MQENKTQQKEQGFFNLKQIHGLQVGGAIQSLLRDLRVSRGQIEQVAKVVSDRKKQIALEKKQAESEAVVVETIIGEETKPIRPTGQEKQSISAVQTESDVATTQEIDSEPTFEKKPSIRDEKQQPVYNNQRSFSDRDYSSRRGDNNFKPRNDQDFTKRAPYDPNRPQGQRTPYQGGQNRPPYQNGQNNNRPPYQNGQNNRPPYQGGQRSFNNQTGMARAPYSSQNNAQREPGFNSGGKPFGMKSYNFAPSKGNNFRSFAPTESASVLAQPERHVGNKNKNPNKNIEEKKQSSVKRNMQRNNIIIEDEDGFNETTMGSRKLIKSRRKEENTFVAPSVETAIITTDTVSVKLLSEKTGKPVTEIIKKLMMLGIMATINSEIDFETAELVASDMGITLEKHIQQTAEEKLASVATNKKTAMDDKEAIKRPPVVTVMGHVDHGKTSLLDAIRETNVVGREAGGITQHIGAYQVTKNGEKITFIDTPGHAAFTEMRARGAKATDVAILVVAADDGVMPQTIEAINHIKAAEVPMIVAINKMDKPTAQPERIKQQLAEHGVLPEEWGGDAVLVPVSAKSGAGIDELLNMILLVSEVQDLKANPKVLATGVVLEASLDKARGPMATVLVQNGTLRIGDNFICGITHGKVKAMYDEHSKLIKKATPSTPVSVLGFDSVPSVGDQTVVVDEKLSKKVIEERISKIKAEKTQTTSGVSLDDFMSKVNEGKLKALNIIIKSDVQGSAEALRQNLGVIANEEAKVVCISASAGVITESDVLLASASKAIIIGFNIKPSAKVKQMANQMKVEIREYNIIYQAVDELTDAINGMLTPIYEEKTIGHAEIRKVFKLTAGVICGSYVQDGKVTRHCGVRVIRDGETIVDSTVDVLKILKDDKAEVMANYECGIKIKDSSDFKEGDKLEFYVKEEVKRTRKASE